MPSVSGFYWVYEDDDNVPIVVWYESLTRRVELVGNHVTKTPCMFTFIRPCVFEHDTNRVECVQDCLGA